MGELTLTTAFAPRDWHVDEMLYGYLPAVITGFLFMVRSALLLVAWSVATKPARRTRKKPVRRHRIRPQKMAVRCNSQLRVCFRIASLSFRLPSLRWCRRSKPADLDN